MIIDFRVLVGVVGILVTSSTTWHRVRNIHLHHGYAPVCDHDDVPARADNDIAVMQLLHPLVFSDTIQAITLSIESRSSLYPLCDFLWFRERKSRTIKKEQLSLWSDNVAITTHEDCAKWYPNVYPTIRCILNPFDIRSLSWGDSGAPVVCDGVLTALLSGGLPRIKYPAKVIMVAPYINWILDVICF